MTPKLKFKFWKVPFGLAQAPPYFQQLINEVLCGLHFAFGYLHILIYNSDPESHMKHLQCLKKYHQYLGHLIPETGIETLREKLSSLQDMSPPRNPKEVKQFVRFCRLL